MKTSTYDIVIVGSGPIGAATAYHLKDSGKNIAVISPEPMEENDEHIDTYKYAGGSVRWDFDDPQVTANTKQTSEFILGLSDVDLSLIKDSYVFLNRGISVPSINISGVKLVKYLLKEAVAAGNVEQISNAMLSGYKKDGDDYVLETTQGQIRANKVLLALGKQLQRFVPEAGYEYEKRETIVLNLPVDDKRASFPHTIIPFAHGIIYLFIKQTEAGKRMLIGQEDIVEPDESNSGQDFLPQLKGKGIVEILPFLKDAVTEKVLWGFDAKNKLVKIYSPDEQLFTASCGSAIRRCIAIGKEVAERLINK